MSAVDGNHFASPIATYLRQLHEKHAGNRAGQVATYIPELAKANPDWFGICLATTDGQVYEVGDTQQLFTIQSISKPFVYGLALQDVGRQAVLRKIGVEPTGDAFNSISLAPETGCPLNPMINAGAITATSLVAGHSMEDKLYRLLAVLSMYAGRSLSIDQPVYESELATGHRNRAIGHMLRNFDVLTDDPGPALDLYFRQCSVAVTCRDLSVMAAALANGGVNPLTGERAVSNEFVESILSVMATCGMYDYAGEWMYWVGMPAKSGVAGGVLAVLPGQLGIGVFSPPLDQRGNSVRGVAACRDLSRDFNLHAFRVPRAARSTVRARYSVAEIASKRRRRAHERRILDAMGGRAKVYDLQGDLGFAAIEAVIRRLVEASAAGDFAIVDLTRVTRIEDVAASIFADLLRCFEAGAQQVLFVNVHGHSRFVRLLEEQLNALDPPTVVRTFSDMDHALEWCENRLIAEHPADAAAHEAMSLSEHDLCHGLDPRQVARLESLLERQRFEGGTLIVRKGDAADSLYLLVHGEVSVTLQLPNGGVKRLSTLTAGMTFGELAVVDHSPRTADVRADTPAECYTLSTAALEQLGTTHPDIKIALLENLLRNAARMVGRLNQEVAALAG